MQIKIALNFFLIMLTFIDFFLIHMIATLMMSVKLGTPGLLKIRIFQNKGYGIILSVHEVTNKILSGDLN